MINCRSIHSKLISISIIILIFTGIYMYQDYLFMFNIKHDASRINFANQLKTNLLEIIWHANSLSEQEAIPPTAEEKEALVREIKFHIDKLDTTLVGLEKGNEKLGIRPLPGKAIPVFQSISHEWNDILRPTVTGFLDLPKDASEKEARSALLNYESGVHAYNRKLDALTGLLEDEHKEKLTIYNAFRFYAFIFFVVSALAITAFLRNTIVRPVNKLQEETRKIEQGHFETEIDIREQDEIGELARSFNQMARTLNKTFTRNTELIKGLNSLYAASKDVISQFDIDTLLNKVADNACKLLDCKYAAALILNKEGKYEFFIPSGLGPRTIEAMKKEHGLPVGLGLLRHILKARKPVRIDDISKHPGRYGFPKGHPRMKSLLGVPIIMNDEVIGALCFTDKSEDRTFSREDEELAVSYSSIVALAMRHAGMVEEIKNLASFPDKNPYPVLECDLNCNITYLNPAAKKIIQDLGIPARRFIPSDLQETALGLEALNKELSYSEIKIGDAEFGEYIHFIKDTETVRIYTFDITEQKRAEKALKKSEERFNLAVKGSTDGIFDWDIVNNTVWWSARFSEQLGYKEHELIPSFENWEALIHPDDHDNVLDRIRAHLERRLPYDVEYRLKTRSGEYRWFRARGQALWNDADKPVRMSGSLQDISIRKDAEEKIERNYEVQNVLNTLLHISLEEKSLTEQLELCLDTLLSVPFLPLMPKGGIFLVEDEAEVLTLIANRGLPVPLQGLCARVPFGRCICGRAAENRRIEFADCIDGRHDISYEGINPHGHYSVPILSKGQVLGVIVLYLQSGHRNDDREIAFLQAVADTLAGMIERKRSEEEVIAHSAELMALADSFNVTSTIPLTENIYEAICNIAVRSFDLKMAWIGLIQKGSYEIKPAARAGFDDGYLSDVRITWDDSQYSAGPAGTAVKAKSFKIINRIDTDPVFELWREQAMKRGYLSCMSQSILDSEANVIGTLNLYSDRPDFFIKRRGHIFTLFANYSGIAIENRLLIEGLEEKIKTRTEELDAAKFQAETANRAKTEFLANMSHELRTPLNAIIGFSDIMANNFAGPMTDKQKEYSQDILDSGKHLLSVINDILDLSKVEAGKMELDLSEFDLELLIKESLVLFKEKAFKHNVKIDLKAASGIGPITADRRKIKQVIYNLVSNAMKFTPDGGSLGIAAQPSSEFDNYIEVSVEDTGIGISGKDQKKLFEPFQQIESVMTKTNRGTGLGLSLCRKFIELHKGSIGVRSESGKGSRFIFAVPLNCRE